MNILSSVNFYPCSNIEATTKFYTEVIGLKLHSDQGTARIFDTGYGYWGFVQYDDRSPNPSGLCLSLNCNGTEGVDLQYKRIIDAGVATLGEPKMHEKFPVYSFFMNDPDGYVVEFQFIQG